MSVNLEAVYRASLAPKAPERPRSPPNSPRLYRAERYAALTDQLVIDRLRYLEWWRLDLIDIRRDRQDVEDGRLGLCSEYAAAFRARPHLRYDQRMMELADFASRVDAAEDKRFPRRRTASITAA